MTHQGPPDLNEIAHRVVAAVTSEDADEAPDARQVEAGRKGGEARRARLSPERRSEITHIAAAARWAENEIAE